MLSLSVQSIPLFIRRRGSRVMKNSKDSTARALAWPTNLQDQ